MICCSFVGSANALEQAYMYVLCVSLVAVCHTHLSSLGVETGYPDPKGKFFWG